jgi:hypothetical protein
MELTETCDQFAAASQKLVRFIDDLALIACRKGKPWKS